MLFAAMPWQRTHARRNLDMHAAGRAVARAGGPMAPARGADGPTYMEARPPRADLESPALFLIYEVHHEAHSKNVT